jgi:DNA polymerase
LQLVTADFETYFGADYTLKKMTTEAYVRDPRFKAHCLGIKVGAEPAVVVDPTTPEGLDYMRRTLTGNAVVAQKAQFDGLILAHHFNIRPLFWIDTLSMARLLLPHLPRHSLEALAAHLGLPKKTVPYDNFRDIQNLRTVPGLYEAVAEGCANDCDLTFEVCKKLLPHVPKAELELIDLTVRMFTEPVLTLDRPRMERFHNGLQAQKQALLDQLGVTREHISSDAKFKVLLEHLGVEVEMKTTAKGNVKPAFSKTDDFMRELEQHEAPHIALLAECRLDIKSTGAETRAKRLLDMDARGPLCVYLNYCGATNTTRWSGGDQMNWQNYTRIDFGDDGEPLPYPQQRGEIRLCIMAPRGYRIVVTDASQIECRLLNGVAGQQDVLQKFRNKEDIYSQLASQFYNFTVTKKNKAERGTGKQLELSCGYGAGGPTIVNTAKLGIYGPPVILTQEQGIMARNLYRNTHREVVGLWREGEDDVLPALLARRPYTWRNVMQAHDGLLWFPNGTYLDYRGLAWNKEDGWSVRTRRGRQRMYGAQLVQHTIQKLARDFVAGVALAIKPYYRIANTTHDELMLVVPEAQADAALAFAIQEMKRPPLWMPDIPLDAEGGHDVRYSK